MTDKPKCPNCKKDLISPYDDKVCTGCATPLIDGAEKNVCPKCGKPIDPEWDRCPQCHFVIHGIFESRKSGEGLRANQKGAILIFAIIIIACGGGLFLLSPLGAPIGEQIGICSTGNSISGSFYQSNSQPTNGTYTFLPDGDYSFKSDGYTDYGIYHRCGSTITVLDDHYDQVATFKISGNNLIEIVDGDPMYTWVPTRS